MQCKIDDLMQIFLKSGYVNLKKIKKKSFYAKIDKNFCTKNFCYYLTN